MAETPETVRDAQTEPEKRDAAPENTTVVGAVTADPVDPTEHIEKLNKESESRRQANQSLTQELEAEKKKYSDLEAKVNEVARKTELDNMTEVDRLKEEKLDAERKAEDTERNANETLKRATVMTMASNMNLHRPEDAVDVIDLSQIPVLNGVPDADAVKGLLDMAIAARPHWLKDQAAPVTPVPADPGPGNPAPVGDPPAPLPSYKPGDDPIEAVRRANVEYRDGHTSLPKMVHNYNRAWEASQEMRTGKMFRKPEVDLPNN